MEIFRCCRSLVRIATGVAFLAACQGRTSVSSFTPDAGNAISPVTSSGYKTLYRFKAGYDGDFPISTLTDVNGALYGTTFVGGTHGAGSVYSVSTSGKESIVYSFKDSPDGALPESGLLNISGTLYGTTLDGGANSRGTVFAISKSGTERVLYSFEGSSSGDGATPDCELVYVSGKLYGTTESGGANNKGTVFAVTPSGSEQVLYTFKGGKDGEEPLGALVAAKGVLYGTTEGELGGSAALWGTVFSITTSGKEKTLYDFKGPPDGAYPVAGLAALNGAFYGTTQEGGTSGWGTVFSISTLGKEKVLHSFKGFADGEYPYAPLLAVSGSLYGTTHNGGRNTECSYFGCGTVYSISTSGSEKVVYAFKDDPDGSYPEGGLLLMNSTLYGATAEGGYGYGTVFQVSP